MFPFFNRTATNQRGGKSFNALNNTVIGPGAHVVGEIRSRDDVEIKGKVTGQVLVCGERKTATLTLEQGGRIDGDVKVDRVHIKGSLSGHLLALGSVQIDASASVLADLRYGRLQIDEGAQVEGLVLPHDEPTVNFPSVAQPAALSTAT